MLLHAMPRGSPITSSMTAGFSNLRVWFGLIRLRVGFCLLDTMFCFRLQGLGVFAVEGLGLEVLGFRPLWLERRRIWRVCLFRECKDTNWTFPTPAECTL